MTVRPPEHLVHGIEGEVVILSARVCSFLFKHAGLAEFRQRYRGGDAELDNTLTAMSIAYRRWLGSAVGTTRPVAPELDGSSLWLSTTEVAGRLLMTDRGVRKAITDGRLSAEMVAGRYRVSREALAHYKASRMT